MSDEKNNTPEAVFNMDGTEHRRGDPECCRPLNESWSKCAACGGRMHLQFVYGGFYHECEDCHAVV